ncbi:hypothetical protein [Bradyrhizobium genosp. A]|uniref:hypothetical protein n=1 Tax=Bradyrhizobium genosp. A TaxID=83626 RepID=UPI003CE76A90
MYRFGHERQAHTEFWLDTSRPEGTLWHISAGKPVSVERWVDAEVLYRDDGFKLVRLGHIPPFKGDTFRYSKGRRTFDFQADRSLSGGTITGTCSIVLSVEPGVLESAASQKAGVEEIVADIDAALRAWPTLSATENDPIGATYFMVFVEGWTDARFTRSGSYKFARGKPVMPRPRPELSRWKAQTLIYPLPVNIAGGRTDEHREALTRDDYVQLVRIRTPRGPANDGPDAFHYADQGISFDFSADHRIATAIPTDTWEVLLDPPHLRGLSPTLRTQLGPDRCAEIAADIEEALYAWPTDRGYEIETPISRVVFLDA